MTRKVVAWKDLTRGNQKGVRAFGFPSTQRTHAPLNRSVKRGFDQECRDATPPSRHADGSRAIIPKRPARRTPSSFRPRNDSAQTRPNDELHSGIIIIWTATSEKFLSLTTCDSLSTKKKTRHRLPLLRRVRKEKPQHAQRLTSQHVTKWHARARDGNTARPQPIP